MDYEDDVDVREQMFHNAVREYIVSLASRIPASQNVQSGCRLWFLLLPLRTKTLDSRQRNLCISREQS